MYHLRRPKKKVQFKNTVAERDEKRSLGAHAINTRAKTSTNNRKVPITLAKIGGK
jgi:hypothetical protein